MYFDKSSNTTNSLDLYSRLLDLNNLYEAFLNCKKGVSWKESVQKYESRVFRNIYLIKNTDKYYERSINEHRRINGNGG